MPHLVDYFAQIRQFDEARKPSGRQDKARKKICWIRKAIRRKCARIRCSRFACSCTVKLQGDRAGAAHVEKKLGALLLNICFNGACFETNFEPLRGANMHFKVRPIIGLEMTAKIRVLYTRPSATNGFYVIGSEFDELGEQARQNLLTLLLTISQLEQDLAGE